MMWIMITAALAFEADNQYKSGSNDITYHAAPDQVGGLVNFDGHVKVQASPGGPFVYESIIPHVHEAAVAVSGRHPTLFGYTNAPHLPGTDYVIRSAIGATNSCNFNNTLNEVCTKSASYFSGPLDGQEFDLRKNVLGAVDIVLNRDQIAWDDTTPQYTDPTRRSIVQVLSHAMMYRVGLGVENDVLALMNEFYPHGGDMGRLGVFTGNSGPNEDDYVGYLLVRPGILATANPEQASCDNAIVPPPEVGLTRYRPTGGSSGNSVANWSSGNVRYNKSSGWVTPPAKIRALYRGCGIASSTVQWRVSTSGTCSGPGTYVVGCRTPSQGAGTPYPIEPYAPPSSCAWDFSSVPVGDYYLCAEIVGGATGAPHDDLVRSKADFVWVRP